MTSRYDILFQTGRFNLSQSKDYFINPCCFGDDVAKWLQGKLTERNIECSDVGQEDWGWYVFVPRGGHTYFVGIGGNAADKAFGNEGEWRFMIEKRRSLWEKLTGKNTMSKDEEIVVILKNIIETDPDIKLIELIAG